MIKTIPSHPKPESQGDTKPKRKWERRKKKVGFPCIFEVQLLRYCIKRIDPLFSFVSIRIMPRYVTCWNEIGPQERIVDGELTYSLL